MTSSFLDAVEEVVQRGNCSGCGACTRIDDSLRMNLDPAGFQRPVPVSIGRRPVDDEGARKLFVQTCPGVLVQSQRSPGAARHATLGPYISAWRSWAIDPTTRFEGSSGGALTALATWLVASGESPRVGVATQSPDDPARTVSVIATDAVRTRTAAGSRYAPTSSAALPVGPEGALVGKPCEISATRQLAVARGEAPPLLLSFFCAGTPSQKATARLVESLGVPSEAAVTSLRYRGHGWPGRFTVETDDGSSWSTSYEESWGRELGPTMQWRCKICPDGIGESADVSAADLWHTASGGYPSFEDADGVSALIARTPRGHDLILRAVAAGVIAAEPLNLDELERVQPFQVERRATLAGRLLGTQLAGVKVPRYRGFGLLTWMVRRPLANGRAAAGSFVRRTQARRAAGAHDRGGKGRG